MAGRNHRRPPARRRIRVKVSRRTPPGASPGTLTVDPSASRPVVRVLSYGPDELKALEIQDLGVLPELVGRRPVLWVDVEGLGDAEVLRRLGKIFKVHPLALEDVVEGHHRAKAEDYGEQLFIVARAVVPGQRVETQQVSIFLDPEFVLTFHEKPLPSFKAVEARIRQATGQIRTKRADYLAYALVDALIDNYFPVLEEYGERLDRLDEETSHRSLRENVARTHELRSDLLLLRRTIWPMRDALGAMTRETDPPLTNETRVFLRDCYDHTVQLIDLLETYREMCADLRDYYLSLVNTRMGEVMKVLTIIGTIFLPLSFVAGVYGMNFAPDTSPWNMPELRWYFGYPFALGVMAGIAGVMLYYFWRRGWLSD